MKIHNYSKTTGEYLNTAPADESPLEPGVFIVPAFSTDIAPPEARPLFKAIFADGKWSVVADHRGEVWFDAQRQKHEISNLGVIPDTTWTPTLPDPTSMELSAAARSRRDSLLAACDWTQARDVHDAVAAAWQPYRQALRDLTKQAGFPTSISWPVAP